MSEFYTHFFGGRLLYGQRELRRMIESNKIVKPDIKVFCSERMFRYTKAVIL